MKKAKLLLMRLLFLPKAVLILLPVISFSALIYIFAAGMAYGAEAYMLFLLNIPMGYMILLTVRMDTSMVYSQYVIYLSALFTFCTMIISVMNLIKYRRAGSPILSAAKVINFTAAMMSLLGLQTAMISCFSEDSEHFRRIMTGITGGCVYGIVIITALIMLIRCRRASADE